MAAGRKPLGPALVEHLEGSTNAKERLELILATIAGKITVVEASQRLGISEAMFYKVRNRVLQVCLEDLEPKPAGRKPSLLTAEQQRAEQLELQVAVLERELAAQSVRMELLQALPQVVKPLPEVKKTNRQTLLRQKLRQRKAK